MRYADGVLRAAMLSVRVVLSPGYGCWQHTSIRTTSTPPLMLQSVHATQTLIPYAAGNLSFCSSILHHTACAPNTMRKPYRNFGCMAGTRHYNSSPMIAAKMTTNPDTLHTLHKDVSRTREPSRHTPPSLACIAKQLHSFLRASMQ